MVSAEATVGEGSSIGPRCVIEGPVVIGEGCRLLGDCRLHGDTALGSGSVVYPYACVGFGPQHVKIKPGDPIGGVRIGPGAVLREHATVHASMYPGQHTVVGERLYLMVSAHIGHDCVLGNDVIVCNGALLAGHCEIGDRVYVSGNAAVHQFCRVGTGAMLAGGTACNLDVPPYCTLVGPNMLGGLNLVGMRRSGVPREEITLARQAYREAFRARVDRAEQMRRLEALADRSAPVRLMADFVRGTKRGVLSGDGKPRAQTLNWLHEMLRPEAWAESARGELQVAGEDADGVA
jgi:UDP-N-acetylglucosamine acyltransferase